MKIIKYITISILLLGMCGCAGWDIDYDPIEDEIIIETEKEVKE